MARFTDTKSGEGAHLASTVVELKGVCKSFGTNRVLSDISLNVEAGHFHVLLGQNGSGKSTLMRILVRTEAIDEGEGSVLAVPFTADPAEANQKIAYVSEAVDFLVEGRVGRLAEVYSRFYRDWDWELFRATARELGIPLDRNFRALSRGQRMQFVYALAVAVRPRLMLLDEITSVLDARARAWVMRQLKGFVDGGGTVILATNIVSEVHSFADRLILIENARIRMHLPIDELSQVFKKLRKPAGVENPVFDDPDAIAVGVDPESDNVVYLTSKETFQKAAVPSEWVDPRRVTAEEAFIYFTRKKAG